MLGNRIAFDDAASKLAFDVQFQAVPALRQETNVHNQLY